MQMLTLVEVLATGQVVEYPVNTLTTISAIPGATYTVIDKATGEVPEDLVLVREGDTLSIEVEEVQVAKIEDFYGEKVGATYSLDGTSSPAAEMAISSVDAGSVGEGSSQIIWPVEGASLTGISPWVWGGAVLGGGVALTVTTDGGAGDDAGVVAVETQGNGEQQSPVVSGGQTPTDSIQEQATVPTANFGAATDDVGPVTGALVSGDTTDDTALLLSGTNESGSSVNVYDGTVLLGAATVIGTTWNYSATVVDGTTYQFNVRETDAAGNESAATKNFIVTGDTTAPTANFSGATDDVGSVIGVLSSGDSTDDTALVLSGTNESGSTVNVYDGTTFLGAATVTGTSWSYSATVADGTTYQFNVRETDAAGNESAATSNFTVTGDTTAPTANFGAATDDVGTVTGALSSGDTTDDTALVLSGTNESGSTVNVYDGTTLLGAATVTGTSWSYSATVADGTTYQFNVKETDSIGNESAATSNFGVTGDTSAPTLTSSSPADEATDVAVTSDITLTFNENVALGSGNITVTDGTDSHVIDVAAHGGQLSITNNVLTINPTADLANNSATYHVEVAAGAITDTAGNSYAGIADSTTINFDTEASAAATKVVFDFTAVDSSGLTGTFTAGDYDIYIKVPATIGEWVANDYNWSGGATLGAGDTITLVAQDGGSYANGVTAFRNHSLISSNYFAWQSINTMSAAWIFSGNKLDMGYSTAGKTDILWTGAPVMSQISFATLTALPDTTAPTVSGAPTPADDAANVAIGDNLSITFDENIAIGTGNITLKNLTDSTQTVIAVTDATQVSISGATLTINPTSDLTAGKSYSVQIDATAIDDTSGNSYAGIADDTTWNFDTGVNTNVVVFDMIQGVSSDHSSRTFADNTAYTIYIRVNSTSELLYTDANGGAGTWGAWDGANLLDSDDTIILVGSGGDIIGFNGQPYANTASAMSHKASFTSYKWYSNNTLGDGSVVRLSWDGVLRRHYNSIASNTTNGQASATDIFLGAGTGIPATTGPTGMGYLTTMPVGILTSQGLVDATAPTVSGAPTPADDAANVAVGDNLSITFDENIAIGTGNITLKNLTDSTQTVIAVTDATQVSISGATLTINPTSDLTAGKNYSVQIDATAIDDTSGNSYAGIADDTTWNFDTASGPSVDTTVVVFDLVGGTSSDHSSRTFQSGVSYEIYVRVDSNSEVLKTDASSGQGTWGTWSGATNLGSDDKIILAGDGAAVIGPFSQAVTKVQVRTTPADLIMLTSSSSSAAVYIRDTGKVTRLYTSSKKSSLDIWDGTWGSNPNVGSTTGAVYVTEIPGTIMTTQGLA